VRAADAAVTEQDAYDADAAGCAWDGVVKLFKARLN